MILYHDGLSLVDGDNAAHLTKQEAKVLLAIFSAYPRVISKEEMVNHVWATDVDEPLDAHAHIKVVICRMRKKLLAKGIKIGIQTIWGSGFRALHEIECVTRSRKHVAIEPSLLEDIADMLDSHPNCGRASKLSSRLPNIG